MIEKINEMCEEMQSVFRTDDGLTLCGYFGHLTFLRRSFDSIDECYDFVLSAYQNAMGK